MRKRNLLGVAGVVFGLLLTPLWCSATKWSDFSKTPHLSGRSPLEIAEILVRNSENAETYRRAVSPTPRHIMFIVSTIVSSVESFLAAAGYGEETAPDPA